MLNGGTAELKGNKIGWWERKTLPKDVATDIELTIDEEYAGRPHLVAFDYYGTVRLTWLVLQYNSIVDVEEEFKLGDNIVIPSPQRALTTLTKTAIRNDS